MVSDKFVVLSVMVAVAAAVPRPDSPPYGPPSPYKEPGMPYDFAYTIRDDYTGNDFGHDESSNGHVASGSYYVLLPDGRKQTVAFSADHNTGYVADVAYEGEAFHPAPAPPSYGPPAPAPPPYGHV